LYSITKFLQILKIIINNPSVLGYLWEHDNPSKKYVIKHHGLKNGLLTVDFLDILPGFQDIITPFTSLAHGSTPVDYALLKGLARKYNDCRYLEIGTWMGESIANVASVAKECLSISESEDELKKKGAQKEEIAVQRFFSKKLTNIKHIFHDSKNFDFSSIGKFDLIFIDADHSYKAVKNDTENSFKVLRDENSIIVWHDYSNLTGEAINWGVFAGILDGCPKDKRDCLYHVSNTMCAIYSKKKLKTMQNTSQIPNKVFSIDLSTKKLS